MILSESLKPRIIAVASDIGDRADEHPVKLEVIYPSIFSRIEEANKFLTSQNYAANVTPFEAIAECAGMSEVVCAGSAAVLSADDMIDLAA
jgi:hypothetical protein